MYRKFVKFRHVVFEICEQTNTYTDMLTAILRTSTKNNVNIIILVTVKMQPKQTAISKSMQ